MFFQLADLYVSISFHFSLDFSVSLLTECEFLLQFSVANLNIRKHSLFSTEQKVGKISSAIFFASLTLLAFRIKIGLLDSLHKF